ncbi:DNA/RNA non-specific endonuclease [Methylobacterium gnaphalii]|uniref:Endonuclease n=1 Tax=Methylobacterium gnaphalii TaxID=1010610 RepID=A0A512JRW1_9HYPH|nr:DNA/RNA non-specific endonuclease [Methylobacterium gnaphalii]GEP12679.1 hypothetical protein MGN01_45240 [Methylobacterium gnaphalii]GLS51702.1 hypothetical protein GCM10007885_45630 [Methylobacterium gnaphalii]
MLVGLALFAGSARAAESCPGHFAEGRTPVLANPRLAPNAIPLCFDAFAVLFSGVSRTPLYAAERLTRASVAAARRIDREDAFHDEDRLPVHIRSELGDFVRSGYDRGHMAPAGDMPTAAAQAQSFSLANIVPQDRKANRGIWAAIEESVRRLAMRRGELYVVTGPIFAGRTSEAINGRILVPTQIYKAVYDPARGEAAAYLADNDAAGGWHAVSISALQASAGLDPFPAMPEAARTRAMALPEPREFSRAHGRSDAGEGFDAWIKRELYRILSRLWRDLMRSIF